VVSAEYDPLLAKLMVVGPDRDVALERLRRALDDFDIGGIQTTLPFHRWLVDLDDFVAGRVRTDLVARAWDPIPLWRAAAQRAVEVVARVASTDVPVHPRATPPKPTNHRAIDSWGQTARQEAVDRWP
ncbi:MAG: hypothetical protein M3432_05005, partial [Chloroflexota bacterium]|nr:hypothetical protein [Chloroflexota bacterium]